MRECVAGSVRVVRRHWCLVLCLLMALAPMAVQCLGAPVSAESAPPPRKESGVFYPTKLVERAKANVAKYPWAAKIRDQVVAAAQPWVRFSDDELWDLMFGATIRRSWMVWSDGYCPACKKGVPMYNWEMDALGRPWKVRCPHCKELFPKNDFLRFYRSGLDEHGVFDPKRADRALLFNAEHPDATDPLRLFGVDDGEGYVADGHRWRFIGAYLIYGQWKQAVHGGIRNLAAAYVVTADKAYAHKAGVLLDRVADLYPSHDFGKQGVMYEGPPSAGYVSTWHDACEETRELALAYDQVFEALCDDAALVQLLARKAAQFRLENPKATFADVQGNIEEGILRHALAHPDRVHSNYPRTPIALMTIQNVLADPDSRAAARATLDAVLEKATAVDGVTGEKGLAGYSSYVINGLAGYLEQCARLDPTFLKDALQRHPGLRKTYRFHIDTHCLGRYYPQTGDTGSFAHPAEQYVGVVFSKDPGIGPSMFTFLYRLAEATGDPAYIQTLYRANGGSAQDLPHDLYAENPDQMQDVVRKAIARDGAVPRLGSVNKEQWHLAILRSGEGANARALWLDYDAGGGHGHADGMNLGLFACGLDLLPEMGYPPVQYGGWGSPRAVWYTRTVAHDTVVVDGQNQPAKAGKTTLWADGKQFRAIRASGPELIGGKQFERTAALVDLPRDAFYVLDVFRVVGGTDHAKFLHSHFGAITTQGLNLQPAEEYGHGTQMRNFQRDPAPGRGRSVAPPGWSVDWQVEDRFHLLLKGEELHLRCTDLTTGAQAYTAEAWVAAGGINSATDDAWIPRILTRRQGKEAPLASTFVAVLEPYRGKPAIASIRRLPLQTEAGAAFPDANAAVEVHLAGGSRDLLVSADAENPLGLSPSRADAKVLVQPEWNLRLDGELCLVRRDAAGQVRHIALCRGTGVRAGEVSVKLKAPAESIELSFERGRPTVVSGDAAQVEEVAIRGRKQRVE